MEDALPQERPFNPEENDVLVMLSWLHAWHRNYNEQKLEEENYDPLPNEEVRVHRDWCHLLSVKDGKVNLVVDYCEHDRQHLQSIGEQVQQCHARKLALVPQSHI